MPQFKRTVTIEVSKEELEAILKEKLGLPKDARISFNMREQSDYMDRYSSYVFSGASVTYDEKINTFSDHDGRGPG